MKKFIVAAFSFLILLTFLSCGEESIELTMSELNPDDSLSARVDMVFIQKVEELSSGKIKINLFTDGKLGDNAQVLQYMSDEKNGIHLARISPAALIPYGCKKSKFFEIPYTFADRNHFWTFATSSSARKILDEPYENGIGVKGLFFFEEGFRHFFSTKQITSIEDFKGKKIRTAGTWVMTEISKCFESEPVTVSYSDLYSALQTGLVDVAENPIINYRANNFHKIAPYMILDGHQLGVGEVVISSKIWDGLSSKNKSILIEAGMYAGNFCKKIAEEAELAAKTELEAQGVTFTTVDDIVPWQKACANVINQAFHEDNNLIELYGETITLAN